MLKFIVNNWKTSLAGLVTLIVAGLVSTGKITPAQGTEIMGALAGFGFIAAKDGNVSGGNVQQ